MPKLSQAKNKIRQFFKRQRKEENIVKGRELIEKEIRDMEFDLKTILTLENMKKVAEKFNFSHVDDMYAAVGYNGISALQVANRLTEKLRKQRDQEEAVKEITTEAKRESRPRRYESGVTVKVLIMYSFDYRDAAIPFQVMKLKDLLLKGAAYQSIGRLSES